MTEYQLRLAFLRQRQSLPLHVKIDMTLRRIKQWYEAWDGKVYVAFSGGKDSTVLLFLVRLLYPHVTAVFVNTGLEFPEIIAFVKTVPNVVWLKPRYTFKQVVQRWGYPVISKDVSMAITRCKNTKSADQRELRLHGGMNPNTGREQTTGVIPKQYHYLLDAPFNCSEYCCNVMKKQPMAAYEKETGCKPFIATMASDSRLRMKQAIKTTCNSFNTDKPASRPMSFWTEEDVKTMMSLMPHSSIYDMGYDRTGCMFCMFGIYEEGTPNRFQRMAKTHPRLHAKALPAFGIDKVCDHMKIPYN